MSAEDQAAVEAQLEAALAGDDEVEFGEMAHALGVTDSKTGTAAGARAPGGGVKISNQKPTRGDKGKTRSSAKGRGRGGRDRGGVSQPSLQQASDAIAGLLKRQTEALPTESDVMEKKIDEMSVASTRLEEDLEEERRRREAVEKKLEELEKAHNLLATQFTKLASRVEHMSKGNEAQRKTGTVMASSLTGQDSAPPSTPNPDSLAAPPESKTAATRGSRVVGGRRRGGL